MPRSRENTKRRNATLCRLGGEYIHNGLPSVEQVFKYCYTHFPSIYKTRVDVLSSIFLSGGNGYNWLDGCIINGSPESHICVARRKAETQNDPDRIAANILFQELIDMPGVDEKLKQSIQRMLDRNKPDDRARPLPDDGKLRVFRLSKHYSNIMNVPVNVNSEWLALTYEAAILLRDRSGIEPDSDPKYIEEDKKWVAFNKEQGIMIVKDLERRFPQLTKRD